MKNRTQRLIFFLVVWLTMFSCISIQAQIFLTDRSKKEFLRLHYPGSTELEKVFNPLFQPVKPARGLAYVPFLYLSRDSNKRDISLQGLYNQPANLYFLQSGYFCKREWELEKITHIPFRFRLGSLADCNALEGKH